MDGRTHARTFDCVFSSTSREQRDLVGKRPLTLPPTPEAENNGKKIKSAFPYEAPLIIVEGHTRLFVAVVVVSLRFIQQRKPFYSPPFFSLSLSLLRFSFRRAVEAPATALFYGKPITINMSDIKEE